MPTLNSFEVITLHEAYKKQKAGTERVYIPATFKKIKEMMPSLFSEGLVNINHLKFSGMVCLTEKGMKIAENLDNQL